MTSKELRNAIYDEFVTKYYQSNLCQLADNADYAICQTGKLNIEEDSFELLEELADSVMEVMLQNNVLTAKKQGHEINQ